MKRLPFLACFMIAGCHVPGRVVEGAFLVDGKPKPGVEVRLSNDIDDSTCAGIPLAAVTDQSGRFTTLATKLPIRPCFSVDGKIYSDTIFLDDGNKNPIKLRCKLPIVDTGHFEDGHVCYE